jgi:hypothetical protein
MHNSSFYRKELYTEVIQKMEETDIRKAGLL